MSIITVAGASGVGKSTFVLEFLNTIPRSALLPSNTTRALRGDEIIWHGVPEYRRLTVEEMLAGDEAREFLHVFGKDAHNYGALYATRRDEFEAALFSPDPHLAILFIPGVELFFDEARILGREDSVHAVFIDLKAEEERIRRLNQSATRDTVRYDAELETWRKTRDKYGEIPFFTLDAHLPPRELVRTAAQHFGISIPA